MNDCVYRRLSALDTAFLDMEQPGLPMHLGSVATFEGGPLYDSAGELRLDDLRARVLHRLPLVPRMAMRLRGVPFGRPVWVDDDAFDITRHVRMIKAPAPGGERELLEVATSLHAELLDRRHPLWEVWFVTGLADHKVGVVQKLHHALGDGVSSVDAALLLLDTTRHPPPVPAGAWAARPGPSSLRLLADGLALSLQEPVSAVRDVARAIAAVPALRSLGTGGLLAARTTFNRRVRSRRVLVPVRLSLADARAVRAAVGGTVNDVVLTAVTGGLRALLESQADVPPASLEVLVPVSTRTPAQAATMGNDVAALVIPVPVGEADPLMRLRAVQVATRTAKGSHAATGSARLLDALAHLPAPALAALVPRFVDRQRLVNLVVTNVPGPSTPLYCMGAELLDCVPIVPLGGNLGLGVAVFSYCGALTLGINVDPDACPDADVFAHGIERTFADLVPVAAAHAAAAS